METLKELLIVSYSLKILAGGKVIEGVVKEFNRVDWLIEMACLSLLLGIVLIWYIIRVLIADNEENNY